MGELVKGLEWQAGYGGHLRAVGGHGDDVNKGRNKARSALEQSSSLSHGGWTVARTRSGERLGCEWE